MEKNYNYRRRKLQLPEYGRHIQQMVESLKSIEDRAERTRQAKAVIAVMGNLNPLLRDTADYTHKLWDHLFIISGFDLDVDSPYPLPSREQIEIKPRRIEYNQRRVAFKHYGKYVGEMIKSLSSEESEEAVKVAIEKIACYMRTKSFEYNQEHPNNEAIIKDIRRMSDGNIEIDEEAINNIQSDYKSAQSNHGGKGSRNGKQQKGASGAKGQNNRGRRAPQQQKVRR
ncbi:MAG: DUF4290 domain-containing protein [Rikenellaceae bacterium]